MRPGAAPPVQDVWSDHLYIRIPRHEIVFFKFILEGYDNLATMTVMDKYEAVLQLAFHSGQRQEVLDLIEGLSSEMAISLVSTPGWRSPPASLGRLP